MEQQETTTKINMIQGSFAPLDAANVIFSMLTEKIKFHQLQELNSNPQTPDQVAHTNERITALQNDKNGIKDLIVYARDAGYDLNINGTITIELHK